MLWPLNNRFTVLPIKEYKENNDYSNTLIFTSYAVITLLSHFQYRLTWFLFISDCSIADHIASYSLSTSI